MNTLPTNARQVVPIKATNIKIIHFILSNASRKSPNVDSTLLKPSALTPFCCRNGLTYPLLPLFIEESQTPAYEYSWGIFGVISWANLGSIGIQNHRFIIFRRFKINLKVVSSSKGHDCVKTWDVDQNLRYLQIYHLFFHTWYNCIVFYCTVFFTYQIILTSF